MPMKYPPHPGGSIRRDCMEPLGMTVEETAGKLGVTPEELLKVINGHSGITLALAVRLDELFGGGASTWYQLQAAYDRAQEVNKEAGPEELGPIPPHQQTTTVHLEHGRVICTTYDAEVIGFRIVPSDSPKPAGARTHDRLEFGFIGEGPGAVRMQLVYQPSDSAAPRLIADVLFKAFLEWNAERDQYIGHIDAGEWDLEMEKLNAGVETMNALYHGLQEHTSASALDTPNPVETVPEFYADVLREAEELLHNGTASVTASALAGV